MLKESLESLLEPDEPDCRVGRMMSEFDEETKAVFIEVMKSQAASRQISIELRKEGIVVDRATIGTARHCFKGTAECVCGYGETQ
jgi:hypothetical protein